MNKIIRVLLFAAALSYAATSKLNAQELNQGLSFLKIKFDPLMGMNLSSLTVAYNMYTESGNDDLAKAKSDLKAKKLYLKTLKASNRASVDFSRSFKEIEKADWQVNKDAIVASFVRNEIRHYIIYDKNGRWVRNMAYFFPNRLPEILKKDVNHAFPDYTINMALEITESNIGMYIVYLENESTIRHVSYCNNEILELDEFRKMK
ncbi:MAG: hypothetical protein ABI151_01190 [Chitinophagaceae bacterium]